MAHRLMTDDQKKDIFSAMVEAFPPLTFYEARDIIGNRSSFIAEIRSALEKERKRHRPFYPVNGEVFELTIDGNASENQPLEIARREDRHFGSKKWQHVGKKWQHVGKLVTGTQTRRFKLISIVSCREFADITRELARHGTIPEGQWCEALQATYQHDKEGPLGVADPSWVNPGGGTCFPSIISNGDSCLYWTGDTFSNSWRWLVGVSE